MQNNHKMSFTGHDRKVVTALIEEGIDAWLEGFIRSHFGDDGHRLSCEVAQDEMQIFVRRLSFYVSKNSRDENADLLLGDILLCFYGVGED